MSHEHDVPPPRDGTSHSSDPSSTPASDPLDLEPLIDELARVFDNGGEATLLAQRAGVPPGWIPAFDLPQVFWHRVIKAAEDGKVSGGAGAIARAAAKLYPNNHVFRRWARAGRPAAPDRALVTVLLTLIAAATATAAWRWWPPSSSPTDPEPIPTKAPITSTKLHDTPASDGVVAPPTNSTSGSPDSTPASSTTTTTGDTSSPPPPTAKKPGPTKAPTPPPTIAPTPSLFTPTADPRRWKVIGVLTDAERFVGTRLTLDDAAPAGTILTLATRCEPPTTSTAGPRCLVREDPDGPAGHYCFTRDPIPVGASLCIHPQGTKAKPK